MRLTNRKTHFTDRVPLLSIRSICTDRHMAYTDRYGEGVLDNPQSLDPVSGDIVSQKKTDVGHYWDLKG